MHKPGNDANEFDNGCGKKHTNDARTVKGLNIDNNDFNAGNGNQKHGKIKKSKKSFAFFSYWVFRMSTHNDIIVL
jgi:hypothetical protein